MNAQKKRYRDSHREAVNASKRRLYHEDGKGLAAQRQWIALNQDKVATRNLRTRPARRVEQLRRWYGLSPQDLYEVWEQQGGGCAICGTSLFPYRDQLPPADSSVAHVDHNHATGEIRGLLCAACNQGLGMFDDDCDRMLQAIGYLQHTAEQPTGYVIPPNSDIWKQERRRRGTPASSQLNDPQLSLLDDAG